MNKKTETNETVFSWQPELRPELPCVYGPVDYRVFREQLEQIDRLLDEGGIEADFVRASLAERAGAADGCARQSLATQSALALRCNLARKLTGLAYREFAVRAAESSLLQWFLRLDLRVDRLGRKRCPAKSTLERYDKWLSAPRMAEFNRRVFAAACGEQSRADALDLHAPVEADEVFFDSTCLKAHIHFPVDWVLLRDATRTLMKATALIRRHGLKHRMPQEPLAFLRRMNHLAMAMSASTRRDDAKRARKKALRTMKALQNKIAAHARAHRELLAAEMEKPAPRATDLSAGRAAVILRRIDVVLEQLPAAIRQAHERIIGERPVANADKILSLYEPDVAVQARGKAGARVEFGDKLWLGETREGLICDYRLEKDSPADTTLVRPALERLREAGVKLKRAWGDRGLFSAANVRVLEKAGIKSGLCPRDPEALRRSLAEDPEFGPGLKRRGGTEARIAIFKNCFVGGPCRAKGFAHREQAVGWAVLAHNLWVLARREIAAKKRREQTEGDQTAA